MTTITTRSGKGSPLTNNEVDANFTNLNDDKIEASGDSMTGDLSFGDNDKAIFGAGSDMSLFHNGNNGFLDNDTGTLFIQTDALSVKNAAGTESVMLGAADGAVTLYHNNAAKLATTSTGIDVTGNVVSDGLTVAGTAQFDDYGGTTGKGRIQFGNSGQQFIEGLDTGNGGSGAYLRFGYGSTETARFDNSGNFGIGTSSPNSIVDIRENATGGQARLRLFNTDQTNSTAQSALLFMSPDLRANGVEIAAVKENADFSAAAGRDIAITFSPVLNNAATERMRIDSSGNVGINVTPESWLSSYKVLQIGDAGALVGSSDDSFVAVGANAYLDSVSSNYEYINSDFATQYYQVDGTHVWRNAASGTADATISWSEAMRLDASGNLLVSGTSSSIDAGSISLEAQGRIRAGRDGGAVMQLNRTTSDGDVVVFYKDSVSFGSIGTDATDLFIGTGDTGIRFNDAVNGVLPYNTSTGQIDATLDLGYSSVRWKDLYLSGTANASALTTTNSGITLQSASVTKSAINVAASTNQGINGTAAGDQYNWTTGGKMVWSTNNGTTAHMILDGSGNLLVGTTDSSVYNNSGSGAGINLQNFGNIAVARDGNDCMVLNRLNSDGAILNIAKDGTTVGSIGTTGGDLTIGTGDTALAFNDFVDSIYPVNTSGANRDNAVTLGDSAIRFKDLYLSGGAYLGGVASANLLDDYEEGEFDATLTCTTSGTITLDSTINRLSYTKIGRQVTIKGRLRISSVSSPTGNIQFTLPFTNSNLTDQAEHAALSVITHDINFPSDGLTLFAEIGASGTVAVINYMRNNAAWAALQANNLDGSGTEYIYINGTYFTT